MIKISKPWKENKNGKTFLVVTIDVPKEAAKKWKELPKKCDAYFYIREDYDKQDIKMNIWYEVEEKYGEYFCLDRNDGFITGMLYYAMITGEDIVSDAPISSKLLFNLNYILIPTFCNIYSGLKRIYVKAETISIPCNTKGEVGTGMSCGIDSLYTAYSLSEEYVNKDYKLTCLTFLDIGASHYVPHIDKKSSLNEINKEAEKIHKNKMKRAKEVADELGLNFIEIRSNISDLYQGAVSQSHGYRNLSAILCLQGYFGKYYYSSAGYATDSYSPSLFKEFAHSEEVAIPGLSTEGLEIMCGGQGRTRYVKTIKLAQDTTSQKFLNVCRLDDNCGHCAKCYRTLIALELLGKVDNFSNVFDINDWKRNKNKAYTWLVINKKSEDFTKDLYNRANKEHAIPLKSKIIGLILMPYLKVKKILWKKKLAKQRGK